MVSCFLFRHLHFLSMSVYEFRTVSLIQLHKYLFFVNVIVKGSDKQSVSLCSCLTSGAEAWKPYTKQKPVAIRSVFLRETFL